MDVFNIKDNVKKVKSRGLLCHLTLFELGQRKEVLNWQEESVTGR